MRQNEGIGHILISHLAREETPGRHSVADVTGRFLEDRHELAGSMYHASVANALVHVKTIHAAQ